MDSKLKIGDKVFVKNTVVCEFVSIETMNFRIGEKLYSEIIYGSNNYNKIYIPIE